MNKPELGAFPATITVSILNTNPITFDLNSTEIPIRKAPGYDAVLVFNNSAKGSPGDGFEVTFTIDDQTRKNYGFFQDARHPRPEDAFSAKVVDSSGHCPSKGASWPDFNPTAVSRDRQTLTCFNRNKHLQYFCFALHFSLEGESSPSLDYDPIGDNQNGMAALF